MYEHLLMYLCYIVLSSKICFFLWFHFKSISLHNRRGCSKSQCFGKKWHCDIKVLLVFLLMKFTMLFVLVMISSLDRCHTYSNSFITWLKNIVKVSGCQLFSIRWNSSYSFNLQLTILDYVNPPLPFYQLLAVLLLSKMM